MKHRTKFLRAFFARPTVIGAVAPSSRALARVMVKWIDWDNAQNIAEYGPGTGIFTEEIISCLKPGARFLAIEAEAFLVEILQHKFPELNVYNDSVANVKALCAQEGIDELDAIVSGLPWAAFSLEQQREFLDATVSVLKPRGQFVTFAYLHGLLLPAGRRFRQMLNDYFGEVSSTRTVWCNLPPAFVYRCVR